MFMRQDYNIKGNQRVSVFSLKLYFKTIRAMASYSQLVDLTKRGPRKGNKRVKVERMDPFKVYDKDTLKEREIDIKDDSGSDIEDADHCPCVSVVEAQNFLVHYQAQVLSTMGQLRMLENTFKKEKMWPDESGKKSRKMEKMEEYANQMIVMLRERIQTWMGKYNGIRLDYD